MKQRELRKLREWQHRPEHEWPYKLFGLQSKKALQEPLTSEEAVGSLLLLQHASPMDRNEVMGIGDEHASMEEIAGRVRRFLHESRASAAARSAKTEEFDLTGILRAAVSSIWDFLGLSQSSASDESQYDPGTLDSKKRQ